MSLNFSIIASGSSGNCSILWNEKIAILIDCGCSAKYLSKQLIKLNINIKNLCSVITHAHIDHISVSGINFLKRNQIPVYVTKDIFEDILKRYEQKIKSCLYIEYDNSFKIGNIEVKSFDVYHKDNNISQTCGFTFVSKVKRRNYKIGYITDSGKICDNIKNFLVNSNILVIESNYNKQMLETSSRPYENKQWILSDFGHLSNEDAAKAISEIKKLSTVKDSLKYVFLAHISSHHNTYEFAKQAVNKTLLNNNITEMTLLIAKRKSKSPTIRIG
ncbi:MAG: MBL fold metallo-hydrolase [Endomicrobium sp.]|nr:MBL fold metallo-hydrolase [Endomicrobium sp.]